MSAANIVLLATLMCVQAEQPERYPDDLYLNQVVTDAPISGSGGVKNLARSHMGTKLQEAEEVSDELTLSKGLIDSNLHPSALIADDETIGFMLPQGESRLTFSFRESHLVQRVNFFNRVTEGSCRIVVRHDGEDVEVANITGFSEFGPVSVRFEPIETKQVRLEFDASKEGRISSVGIYGDLTFEDLPGISSPTLALAKDIALLADPKMGGDPILFQPRTRLTPSDWRLSPRQLVQYNLSDIYAGARVIGVSSGTIGLTDNTVDDDVNTYYGFELNDTNPAAIVDMKQMRRVKRFSALLRTGPGLLDVFILRKFPVRPVTNSLQPMTQAILPTVKLYRKIVTAILFVFPRSSLRTSSPKRRWT